MRVLLIENDFKIRSALKQGLEEFEHQVDTALDERQAQAMVIAGSYEVIVSDVPLTDSREHTLHRQLSDIGNATPILILTEARPANLPCCTDQGRHDFLLKPFEFKELLVRISRLAE